MQEELIKLTSYVQRISNIELIQTICFVVIAVCVLSFAAWLFSK